MPLPIAASLKAAGAAAKKIAAAASAAKDVVSEKASSAVDALPEGVKDKLPSPEDIPDNIREVAAKGSETAAKNIEDLGVPSAQAARDTASRAAIENAGRAMANYNRRFRMKR